jgi:hypothetical protein
VTICVALLGQALSKLLGLLSIAKGENYQAKNRKIFHWNLSKHARANIPPTPHVHKLKIKN